MKKEEVNLESERGKAYTAAQRRLREQYPTEWQTFLREEYHDRGVPWNPRLKPEEREQEQLRALIEKHPDLARTLIPDDEEGGD